MHEIKRDLAPMFRINQNRFLTPYPRSMFLPYLILFSAFIRSACVLLPHPCNERTAANDTGFIPVKACHLIPLCCSTGSRTVFVSLVLYWIAAYFTKQLLFVLLPVPSGMFVVFAPLRTKNMFIISGIEWSPAVFTVLFHDDHYLVKCGRLHPVAYQ